MKHKLQSLITIHRWFAGSRTTALLTVLALLCNVSMMRADNAGFFSNGAHDLYISYKTTAGGTWNKKWLSYNTSTISDETTYTGDDRGFNATGVSEQTIGTVTHLYIDATAARVWKNGSGNVCGVTLYYKIGSSGTQQSQALSYSAASGNNQVWQWTSNNNGKDLVSLAGGAGSYTLYWWYSANTDQSSSSGGCGTTKWMSNNSSNYSATFTVAGWITESGTYSSFATIGLGSTDTKDITLGTHYGSTTTATASLTSGHTSDFEVVSVSASTIRVKFKPTAGGSRSAVITITDAYSKTRTLTVTGTAIAPTILIAKNESVAGSSVTLNGYVKYNGCKTITDYGFVYSASNSTPTLSDTKVQVGTDALTDGSVYSETFTEGVNGTYYYRPYMVASGTTYYSTEERTFTVDIPCEVTDVTATIDGGNTTATAFDGSVSDEATLSTDVNADEYLWECTSANSSHATIASATSRETTVTVDAEGTYTFRLGSKCTGDGSYTYSGTLTMYVCVPATSQTVLLDGYTANVLCEGETAVASCISQTGFTYTLYGPSGVDYGALTGNGSTLQWRNVAGEGTFSVKAAPSDSPNCFVNVGTATQTYNLPFMKIDVDPGLSVIAYKAVTLSKNSDSDTDGDFIWEITSGAETSYLLHPTKGLIYDGRAREDVEFKGGADDSATSYTITATGTKTVTIGVTSDTKSCDATESVTISVSPATAGSCE